MESAQIGSYKYSSIVKTISLSEDGLTFFVPTFKNGKSLLNSVLIFLELIIY